MTNLKISALVIILSFFLVSCDKNIDTTNFTNEEAAEIITNALQNGTNGISEELADITKNITENIEENFECGVKVDTNFVKNITKLKLSAEYDVSWAWTPTCNALGNMTSLDYTSAIVGGYEGPKSTSTETKTTTFVITGTQITSTALIYDGNSANTGTHTLSVKNSKEVESNLTMVISSVTVDKLNQEISEGTATFTLTATLNGGETSSFTGSIEFLGNKSATLIINGEVYPIQL